MGGASEGLVRHFILSVLLPALGISLFLIFFIFYCKRRTLKDSFFKSKGRFFPSAFRAFSIGKKSILDLAFSLRFLFLITIVDAWDSISLEAIFPQLQSSILLKKLCGSEKFGASLSGEKA